jgi:hypothetical protein
MCHLGVTDSQGLLGQGLALTSIVLRSSQIYTMSNWFIPFMHFHFKIKFSFSFHFQTKPDILFLSKEKKSFMMNRTNVLKCWGNHSIDLWYGALTIVASINMYIQSGIRGHIHNTSFLS